MYRTDFWTLWERARVGWFGRIALKHVYYHMWNRLPVQVWCMRQGAQGWCTGMTLRDGMERVARGEFRMGDTCTPMANSCQCMAKTNKQTLQYCKVISLQLKYINFFKKEFLSTILSGCLMVPGLWNSAMNHSYVAWKNPNIMNLYTHCL